MKKTKRLAVVAAMLSLGLALSVTAPPAHAQGLEEALVIAGPLIAEQAKPYLRDVAGKLRSYIGWLRCGGGHTWWYCRYADGAVVANNFRCHRDMANVVKYFTAQHRGGDCDAVDLRTRQHICYGGSDDQSRQMVRVHGPIVAIWPQ